MEQESFYSHSILVHTEDILLMSTRVVKLTKGVDEEIHARILNVYVFCDVGGNKLFKISYRLNFLSKDVCSWIFTNLRNEFFNFAAFVCEAFLLGLIKNYI